MRRLAACLFLLICGCTGKQPVVDRNDAQIAAMTVEIDSLAARSDSLQKFSDSLKVEYNGQITLIKFVKLSCHNYALIVSRNPENSRFIVGWIDRAFDGAIKKRLDR